MPFSLLHGTFMFVGRFVIGASAWEEEDLTSMAVVVFLLGFLFGLLALALAEGAALLWAIRALRPRPRRTKPPPLETDLSRDRPFPTEKQGFLWMLEPEKMPKVRIPTGGHQGIQHKKNILEVFPVRMLAKIKGHSLILSAPDGSQITIQLLDSTVVAVSASNLPSRKWAKRYPIKIESKGSDVCKGSKVCYLYVDTSWEKESWCKALRLASTADKEKLNLHTRLSEEFSSYISSLNDAYPYFLKPSAVSAGDHEVMDKAVKSDGSSKVRLFLKKLGRKASTKAPQESKTSSIPAQAERKTMSGKVRSYHGASLTDAAEDRSSSSSSSQDIKQPGTPSSDFNHSNQLSDSSEANIDENYTDEGTLCWNLLISRLFFDAKTNDEISKAIKARIQRALSNMRTAAYIGDITLTDLNLGKLPPYLRRMRVLPRDLNELWAFEVDFEYCSGILLHIEARLEVQEPELQKDIMKTTQPNGDVNSEFLESIEHYGNQFRSSELLPSVVEDKDESDVLRQSKSTGWTSTYISRWKNILHSITDHVSQVPFSLAIKITSVRGTMRIHIKPPPSDQIWYGFTSMPELEWELESSVGDKKITNTHIAMLIGNRIKASLHQTLVLPNCESIPMSWMISEKDDWVPRKVAPFIWLSREPTETVGNVETTALIQTEDVSALKVSAKDKASKSSLPTTEMPTHRRKQEPASEASTSCSSLDSELEVPFCDVSDQLGTPLLSTRQLQEAAPGKGVEYQGAVVPASAWGEQPSSVFPEEDDAKRKSGRRALVMGLGKRMGEKLEEKRRTMEEKGRHIMEKMKENSARTNS